MADVEEELMAHGGQERDRRLLKEEGKNESSSIFGRLSALEGWRFAFW
jgi:hypothetical protein